MLGSYDIYSWVYVIVMLYGGNVNFLNVNFLVKLWIAGNDGKTYLIKMKPVRKCLK